MAKESKLSNISDELFQKAWETRIMGTSKIAKAVGCSPRTVKRRAKRMGLRPRDSFRFSDDEFRSIWAKCSDVDEVVTRTGYVKKHCWHRANQMGLPSRPADYHEERNPSAKYHLH